MDIDLNFINNAPKGNEVDILIFQRNVAPGMGAEVMAWKVIRRCGYGCNHPFKYPMEYEVSVRDSYGNYTPRMMVLPGMKLSVSPQYGGHRLHASGKSELGKEFEVCNDLPMGARDVCVYKGGQMLAIKRIVVPEQKAVFQFEPVLWLGTVAQVEQGKPVSSEIISSVNTAIPLTGIFRADIVMTGGGDQPYSLTLENVNPA